MLQWFIGWLMINLFIFIGIILFVMIYLIIMKIKDAKEEIVFRIKATKK